MINQLIQVILGIIAGIAAAYLIEKFVDYLDKKALEEAAKEAKHEYEEKNSLEAINKICKALVKEKEPKKLRIGLLDINDNEVAGLDIVANEIDDSIKQGDVIYV